MMGSLWGHTNKSIRYISLFYSLSPPIKKKTTYKITHKRLESSPCTLEMALARMNGASIGTKNHVRSFVSALLEKLVSRSCGYTYSCHPLAFFFITSLAGLEVYTSKSIF